MGEHNSNGNDQKKQSIVWGSIVVILLILTAMLLIGYFAWWMPTHGRHDISAPREDGLHPGYHTAWSVVGGIASNDPTMSILCRFRH